MSLTDYQKANFRQHDHTIDQLIDPATGSVVTLVSTTHTHIRSIQFVIDGGLSVPATGSKGRIEIPTAATITSARIVADQSGSAVVDIKKSTYANIGSASSICASAKPTLSSALKNQDSTLTGWTTALTAGDWLEYNLDSVTTCLRITVSLTVTM